MKAFIVLFSMNKMHGPLQRFQKKTNRKFDKFK